MTSTRGSGQEGFKFRGSCRVGSGGVEMSRVLPSRANNVSILAGRVWSGQEIFKSHGSGRVGSRGFQISRVGSGRFMRCLKCHGSGQVMTREIQVSRGSGHNDPRVFCGRPAGRTRGFGPRIRFFANVQLPAGEPLPEGHSRDPWVLPAGPKLYILAASCLKTSLEAIPRTPSAYHSL